MAHLSLQSSWIEDNRFNARTCFTDVLSLDPVNFTLDDVDRSARKLLVQSHPDKHLGEAVEVQKQFQAIYTFVENKREKARAFLVFKRRKLFPQDNDVDVHGQMFDQLDAEDNDSRLKHHSSYYPFEVAESVYDEEYKDVHDSYEEEDDEEEEDDDEADRSSSYKPSSSGDSHSSLLKMTRKRHAESSVERVTKRNKTVATLSNGGGDTFATDAPPDFSNNDIRDCKDNDNDSMSILIVRSSESSSVSTNDSSSESSSVSTNDGSSDSSSVSTNDGSGVSGSESTNGSESGSGSSASSDSSSSYYSSDSSDVFVPSIPVMPPLSPVRPLYRTVKMNGVNVRQVTCSLCHMEWMVNTSHNIQEICRHLCDDHEVIVAAP